MENMWQYIIIIVVLLIVALAITKSKKKDFKIEANRLVEYLGGKGNIINYEVLKSRFVVTLKNNFHHFFSFFDKILFLDIIYCN